MNIVGSLSIIPVYMNTRKIQFIGYRMILICYQIKLFNRLSIY
ncbi:hypothetical protein [Facklamia lactis]|nr:hypothetical protein [Facklamia lactis]